MKRLNAILILTLVGFCLPGCSAFKKWTGGGSSASTGGDAAAPSGQTPPPKFPTGPSSDTKPADPLNGQSKASSGVGMLAGRVIDGGNRPPAGTSILVVNADDKDDSAGREVSVSPEGYFTIENLKPGGQYKLVARGKQGDRAVAGVHYATATNVRVLVQMKDDLVGSTTPAVEGPYGSLKEKKFEPLSPSVAKTAADGDSGWRPGTGIDVASNEVALPAVNIPTRPDPIVGNGGWVIPPPLEIKPIKSAPPTELAKVAPTEIPAIPAKIDQPSSLGPTNVPSAVLVGRQLVNFALNDINGETWELKANRKGNLVLIDFWGTWCAPCRRTMPALKGLQNKYAGRGLEVVGIAYEQGGTPQEQAYRVNDVCQKLLINYRQLLGGGPSCPLRTQLGIRAFPTLILVDEQGTILWRHEGQPSPADIEELERLIQSRGRTSSSF